MRKRLLLCSIACPPKNGPESLQVGKYIQGLLNTGEFNIDVFTSSSPTLFMPEDKSLNKYLDGVGNIYTKPINENKYLNFMKRKVGSSNIFRPDSKYSFYKYDDSKLFNSIEKPDVIYSRSFPISSTLEAFKLQDYFNVPWVLHLSDPWSWSPIHYLNEKNAAWNKEWERKCFEKASLITLTSLQTIAHYSRVYPEFKKKFFYCPNVLESVAIGEIERKEINKCHFVYTGGLVGKRTLKPFFDAISLLNSDELEQVSVTIAGPMDRANRALLKQYKNLNINYQGTLSYNEAKALQLKSDILIVVDNEVSTPEDAVFFPSKVLDYFITQKTILAITTPGSCTESVLSDQDIVIYRNQTEQILETLKKLVMIKPKEVNRSKELMLYNNLYQGKLLVNKIKHLLNEI